MFARWWKNFAQKNLRRRKKGCNSKNLLSLRSKNAQIVCCVSGIDFIDFDQSPKEPLKKKGVRAQ